MNDLKLPAVQRRQSNFIRIGKARLVAADGPYADALVDTVRALFDNAVFQRPGLETAYLKVELRIVDRVTHDAAEDPRQVIVIQPRPVKNFCPGYF